MTETELLEAARGGDAKAFRSLITTHSSKAWNVCLRVCGNYHDAEDALQDAMSLAWRNLGKFQAHSAFGTWFYRIAYNVSIDLIRRRREATSIDEDAFGEQIQLVDHSAEFENQLADNEMLVAAMSHLSEDAREALILHEVAGLKVAEIAAHQGSSASAVKVRLHRARKSLAQHLEAVH